MGSVTDITLAYKFEDSLDNILRISECRLQIKELVKNISLNSGKKHEKYQKKIEKLKKVIKNQSKLVKKKLSLPEDEEIDLKNMTDEEVLKAFISFEDSNTPLKLKEIINKVGLIRLPLPTKATDVVSRKKSLQS